MCCRVECDHAHSFLRQIRNADFPVACLGHRGMASNVFCTPSRGFCTRVFLVFVTAALRPVRPTCVRWGSDCFAMDPLSRRGAILTQHVVCIRRCFTIPRERAPHGCGGLTLPPHSTPCCLLYGRQAVAHSLQIRKYVVLRVAKMCA